MSFQEIIYAVDAAVATVTLNRPAQLNAWTSTMEREFRAALNAAEQDAGVHVIVVTGAGRGFCAGADMGGLNRAAATPADLRAELAFPTTGATGIDANYDKRFSYLLRIGKPIIAAINGPIAGLGVCVAAFCDIRFMSEGAKLTTAFAERGLIAEHGVAWMLPRLVGPMNALELLYCCRAITAADAERLGFARLLPAADFLSAVQRYAVEIAARSSPRSLRIIKRQVYDSLLQSLAESADAGDEEMFASFFSEDFHEGVAHYADRRAPRFTGR